MISCSTAVFMRLSFAVDGEWWESCGLGLWIRAGLRNAICSPHSTAEEGTSSRRTRILRIGMGSVWLVQPGWAVGRSRISLSVILRGRVTANAMTSATSSAVMANWA